MTLHLDVKSKIFEQQEDDSTKSKCSPIHKYSVIDKSKIDNETSGYTVVDRSRAIQQSVTSLEDKSEKLFEEEFSSLVSNAIVETKHNNQPFLKMTSSGVTESTFSMSRNEFLRKETGQQQKANQNEDTETMQHSKQNVYTVCNKWCILSFIFIVLLVIILAFIILVYSSILQLKPKIESCSNMPPNLEKLLTTHLGNLDFNTTSLSTNTIILEQIFCQYPNLFQHNVTCTLTCITNAQSTATLPTTVAPAMSRVTTQSVTRLPNIFMDCRDNFFDIVNSNTWKKVAELNMTIPNTQCPSNLTMYNTSGLRTCRRINHNHSCTSIYFHTNGMYSKIFGAIRAYQYMRTNSFQLFRRGNRTIDDPYVDGVSLTYGSPRQHIWTFASDISQTNSHCPCGNLQSSTPDFVGEDYFCDSGVQEDSNNFTSAFNNPLWDGRGCREGYNCCNYNNPPWFCKQLSNSTSEPIELRICSDQSNNSEDIAIEKIHLFVHE